LKARLAFNLVRSIDDFIADGVIDDIFDGVNAGHGSCVQRLTGFDWARFCRPKPALRPGNSCSFSRWLA
jgi:hypothetical protein